MAALAAWLDQTCAYLDAFLVIVAMKVEVAFAAVMAITALSSSWTETAALIVVLAAYFVVLLVSRRREFNERRHSGNTVAPAW